MPDAARPPFVEPEHLSPEQRAAYDAVAAGPRGVVPGPLRIWVLNPQLSERAQKLGEYCRYGTSLPPRLSELAIITAGAYWRSGYEWCVHAPIAAQAGISAAAIEAIRTGGAPDLDGEDEAAVHDFVRTLLETQRVPDALYQRLVGCVGVTGAVDLVGIVGYYSLICLTINAFQVPVPEGEPEPFA